ncbi:hypothetical protein BDY21DRAFT_111948 [Lineolata rhizophorae]|uniref:Uncharacterized protein n=1 Tax=Lineolata rhizophorae TaxID=578093 RepID=A0A6A6NQS3_9PEZI|nr:hypothetical protein BDY21DRAFT_111948 [Lineolata rhizophorae]
MRLSLLQVSELSQLQKPEQAATKLLQRWLEGESEGDSFLKGVEIFTWDEKEDLITLHHSKPRENRMVKGLGNMVLKFYHTSLGHRIKRQEKPISHTNRVMNSNRRPLLRTRQLKEALRHYRNGAFPFDQRTNCRNCRDNLCVCGCGGYVHWVKLDGNVTIGGCKTKHTYLDTIGSRQTRVGIGIIHRHIDMCKPCYNLR